MFETYTENALRAIFVARYEASRFGAAQMETEHLLLALLTVDPESIVRLLREGDSAEAMRARIHERTPKQPMTPTSADLPLSDAFKRVLRGAAEESDRLHHELIGTEHLVVGLLREEGDPAARLLSDAGATLQAARERLEKTPAEELRGRGTERNSGLEEFLRDFAAGSGPATLT